MKYFINTGTVTNASRGRDILRKNGIAAFVETAKGALASTGCGYGITVGSKQAAEKAQQILGSNGIRVFGISPIPK